MLGFKIHFSLCMFTSTQMKFCLRFKVFNDMTLFELGVIVKGLGPQTIVCAFYESIHVAEQFATNFMKINQGIRKL